MEALASLMQIDVAEIKRGAEIKAEGGKPESPVAKKATRVKGKSGGKAARAKEEKASEIPVEKEEEASPAGAGEIETKEKTIEDFRVGDVVQVKQSVIDEDPLFRATPDNHLPEDFEWKGVVKDVKDVKDVDNLTILVDFGDKIVIHLEPHELDILSHVERKVKK
jgi:hypothetical protein